MKEFESQVHNLIEKNYPTLTGISEKEFLAYIDPLREKIKSIDVSDIDIEQGYLPFVIVIKHELISAEKQMMQVKREEKEGITKLFPLEPHDFKPIESVLIPDAPIYLLIDIERGKDTINLPPKEALEQIIQKKRSPLTIEEGIAIVTHHPEFLIKNNCFSLLASRHEEDQRVPAIWINSKKQPNLGWCWNGNPHTWLGSASCETRID